DHFLSLCPTELTVYLLEERLTAAEKIIAAVGASRGDSRAPFFEGSSRVPLLPSIASAAAVNLVGTEEVGAPSAPSGRRRNCKGKGSKGGGGDGDCGGGGGGGGRGGGSGGGGGAGMGGFSGGGAGGGGCGGGGAGRGGAAQRGGFGGSQRQQQLRSHETPSALKLREWYAGRGSAEGDCNLCVLPDPGIEAAALGASESAAPGTCEYGAASAGESTLSGTAPREVLHTFTLDSGASRSFFRDSTTLTPLSQPVAVSLADPSGDPVLAHSSTVLLCPAAASGMLSGLHLPSFSTNLVSGADLQDAWVDQFTPGGQRVTHCTCSHMGRHLATFTGRLGSSLNILITAPPPVSVSGQVAASSQLFVAASRSSPASAPCSCRPLSHETLLWHHRLGHPSLPRLRGMASRTLGTRQTFTLPASPQQNGIAERRIGMVMDVVRTSMIHAAAPHFLWLFAVQYAAHLIKLQRRVSLPETTPTLRWTGKVGNASVFRVWGSRDFIRDASADKLSSRAVPCIFLEFPLDAPGWQFYHPTSRRVLSSQDVTFDESVSYYRLFPYRIDSLPPPPLFLAPSTPPVDPLRPQGPPPSSVSQVDLVEPVEVAVDSGAARGAKPAGAGPWDAEPGDAESEGAEPGGAEPERVEPGGAEPGVAESGGAEPGGAEPERALSGGPSGVPSRREPLSPQLLREWYARRCSRAAGATRLAAGGLSRAGAVGGAAGAGAAEGTSGAGAAGGAAGAGAARGAAGCGATGAAGPGGAGARGTSAVAGPAGAGAAGPGGARTRGTGAAGAGGAAGAVGGTGASGAARVVLGLPPSTGPTPPLLSPPPVLSQSQLQPASPLPGPSPYSGPTRGLTVRREPESRPALPESRLASAESRPESPVRAVCTGRRVPSPRPPPVPGTHSMTLYPSTAPQRVPPPSPPMSSLPDGPDPESDSLRAASPTIKHFLVTAVTDPSFESTAVSALVAELVDFAAACRLDYAASVVPECESSSVCVPFVGGECALGTDVLEDR
ncbi:unnamed protein product, partial [Closterium sp. NIES-54]